MRRLLALALLLAWPASAQYARNVTAETVNVDGSSSAAVPATCTTAGQVPAFLGSPLALGCVAGISINPTTAALTIPAGTAAAPSLNLGNTTGLYRYSATVIGFTNNGGLSGFWGPAQVFLKTQRLTLGDGNLDITAPASYTMQIGGADSASPGAAVFRFPSATGTNVAGAKGKIRGSLGTGLAAGGDLEVATGVPGTTGSTANGEGRRWYITAAPKGVSTGVSSNLFEISLPTDDTATGYEVQYTLTFGDGTNTSSRRGVVRGGAYRATGGTVTAGAPVETGAPVTSSGKDAAVVWAATAGTAKVTVSVTPTEGSAVGTATRSEISYQVWLDGRHTTISPL